MKENYNFVQTEWMNFSCMKRETKEDVSESPTGKLQGRLHFPQEG